MTASSPGLMMAVRAEIIASVAPQVTVTFFSGSAWMPLYFAYFRHSASRSGLAPQVIAYWLTSDVMARQAACLIASGAAKSGYPWERLIAPCFAASRVISRMTLSVNSFAFSATKDRAIEAQTSQPILPMKGIPEVGNLSIESCGGSLDPFLRPSRHGHGPGARRRADARRSRARPARADVRRDAGPRPRSVADRHPAGPLGARPSAAPGRASSPADAPAGARHHRARTAAG